MLADISRSFIRVTRAAFSAKESFECGAALGNPWLRKKLNLQSVSETGNPQSHYENARFFRSYSWWNRNVYLELHRS
ncbi:MAG: hypothetical protein DME46_01065 [Verrucomicrobia bacterium]|nr:MAG: hypothetical protein DME46_01065 [Verrucomicrobiota bacterium]